MVESPLVELSGCLSTWKQPIQLKFRRYCEWGLKTVSFGYNKLYVNLSLLLSPPEVEKRILKSWNFYRDFLLQQGRECQGIFLPREVAELTGSEEKLLGPDCQVPLSFPTSPWEKHFQVWPLLFSRLFAVPLLEMADCTRLFPALLSESEVGQEDSFYYLPLPLFY